MQPPPSSFEPAITVSALALRNLKQLPFARFSLQHSISSTINSDNQNDPILQRAQWLEHGVGSHTAFNAAALAHITETLPSALASLIPLSSPSSNNNLKQSSTTTSTHQNSNTNNSKHTHSNTLHRNNINSTSTNSTNSTIPRLALWIFGTTSVVTSAKQLLQNTFQLDQQGIWTPQAPESQTFALTRAIHRALSVSLEAEGAIRVADQLLHMPTSLSYSFVISLGHGKNPHILIRVAVRHLNARFLTDDDHAIFQASENKKSFPVFTSPLGIKASLSRRPIAGDALTIAVTQRWKEAGLLPNKPIEDSTVIFLKLENGAEVPFPRVCVLTTEPLRRLQDVIKDISGIDANNNSKPSTSAGKVTPKSNMSLWKSRKRPRSPNAECEDGESTNTQHQQSQVQSNIAQAKTEPIVSKVSTSTTENHSAALIPTAKSLNAAIEKERETGNSDPVPLLRHPLVKPILPPSFPPSNENGSKQQSNGNESKTTQDTPGKGSEQVNGPTTKATVKEENETVHVQSTSLEANWPGKSPKLEPESHSHMPDTMDEFLLDGDGAVDLNNITFDDDVTKFFGGGIDEKQGGDSSIGQDEFGDKSQENDESESNRKGQKDSRADEEENSHGSSDNRMDVDTDLQDSATQSRKIGISEDNSKVLPIPTVVKFALHALKHPLPKARPKREEMVTNLATFYEEDLTQRRKNRLSARRSIKKRSRTNQRAVLALHKELLAGEKSPNGILRAPDSSPLQTYPSDNFPQPSVNNSNSSLNSLFVPTRLVKAYGRLSAQERSDKKCLDIVRRKVEEDTDSEDGDHSVSSPDQSDNSKATQVIDTLAIDDLDSDNGKSADDAKRNSEHGDNDTRNIFDSVAVDCCSACYVLAEHMVAQCSVGSTGSGANDISLSPGSLRDDDAPKSAQASHTHLATNKSSLPSGVIKHAAPSHLASPSNRAPTKKDRELFSLLALLEMQLFSSSDLDILPEMHIETPDEHTKSQGEEDSSAHGDDTRSVSSAMMRRVLLGLPRALETSQSFGSCLTELKSASDDASGPTVNGPLSVNEFLGGCASIFPLSTPRVCVGYNKEWIETSSGSLPLWEKSGLEPYSERKNVEYVALAPKEIEGDVRLFLRDVSAAYEECSFGKHAPMPFDSVMPIGNSVASTGTHDNPKKDAVFSDVDKAMVQQYHLTITGLCTKLTTVTRDHRKNSAGSPTNIVVYIVSPFSKQSTAANVALVKAVLPLINNIPGTVLSNSGIPPILNLPSAPWRSSPSSKSVVSITVRLLPREVVDVNNTTKTTLEQVLQRPLRPQLMKAISFAVFSAIRNKRVRSPTLDGEIAGVLSRSTLPDDLLSPMTPEILAESPGGTVATPLSPIGAATDDNVSNGNPSPGTIAVTSVDQSSALSTSLLHEPAIVLAGVGKHMGQTDGKLSIVMHLAYAFSESSSRYMFAWTDERGEMLDIASVPVLGSVGSASRRKAFWGMWARGQRWRMPYVEHVHTTISKLGTMDSSETDDWNRVLNKVLAMESGGSEKKPEEIRKRRIVQRFPAPEQSKGEDISDAYPDLLTPATPSVSQPTTNGTSAKSTVSMDVKLPSTSSITLLTVCNANTHLFMEKPNDSANSDRRDFAIVSDISLSTGHQVQANTILARFEENGIGAIELSIVRHYGNAVESEEMSDQRSLWDCYDIEAIATAITNNFHELRYVASPPSWPHKRWLSIYPVHLEAVRSLKAGLRLVHNHTQGVPHLQSRS